MSNKKGKKQEYDHNNDDLIINVSKCIIVIMTLSLILITFNAIIDLLPLVNYNKQFISDVVTAASIIIPIWYSKNLTKTSLYNWANKFMNKTGKMALIIIFLLIIISLVLLGIEVVLAHFIG